MPGWEKMLESLPEVVKNETRAVIGRGRHVDEDIVAKVVCIDGGTIGKKARILGEEVFLGKDSIIYGKILCVRLYHEYSHTAIDGSEILARETFVSLGRNFTGYMDAGTDYRVKIRGY